MEEPEDINGFTIPKRELTEEEATRKITVNRIRDFHHSAGEDFLDTTSEGDGKIFCGWVLHKYPQHSKEILDFFNHRPFDFSTAPEIADFYDLSFYGYAKEFGIDKYYFDYAEFVNQTEHLKKRVNQVLIQVAEHYED